MGRSTVMLSVAKHLSAHSDRPFASLRVTVEGPISSSGLFCETSLSALGGSSAIQMKKLNSINQAIVL